MTALDPAPVDASGEAIPDFWGTPSSRTVTWYDPRPTAAAASMSGMEFLSGLRDGAAPPPPIALVLGMRLRTVERGRVVFEYEPDESVYNPIGTVHGGVVCTLADTVIGCAVHTTLVAGVGYTSIDLQVSYLRPLVSTSGPVVATGTVVKPGRRVAFARAESADGAGNVVAEATGSCLVMDGRVPPA
ncbi:MAG TPA: PaaI family thioesterase [Acidimicrobiales bacterium]|nr:PaaI family thioesterase [Acidimicrobiales bacterium]